MSFEDSLAPKSDQLNAEDLLTGPRTFTVDRVTPNTEEQPFDFHLVELPGRPYRPSKTMRRVIAAAWGTDETKFAGRRFTLYRDPEVKFGREKVGGIKISHLSHIDRKIALALTETRGRRVPHEVLPLAEKPAGPTTADVAAQTDIDTLRSWWNAATPDVRKAIQARVEELTAKETDQ